MKMQRHIATMVVFATLYAAFVGPFATASLRGDVNGDQETNVLDLQLLTAEMISGKVDHRAADLNRDGCIDVLDFQILLQQTTLPEPAPETRPTESKAIVLSSHRMIDSVGQVFFAGPTILSDSLQDVGSRLRPLRSPRVILPPCRALALLGASPNSPPLA